MHSFTLPFILALGIPLASATLGIDGCWHVIDTSNFTCLKHEGHSFYISRVWSHWGAYDSYGIQNIKNAWAGGMSRVDAHINPCIYETCPAGVNQVEAALNKLKSEAVNITQVWLEVSFDTQWENNDENQNRQIIIDMAKKAVSMGYSVGIYTIKDDWEDFMGTDFTAMSAYPLWWSREDGKQDFSGFTAFGGWSKPSMHQFNSVENVHSPCFNVDMTNEGINWYP